MKAVGYIRVSTDEQAIQGVSLDAQKAKLEAYASLYEIDLIEIIVDAGQSAKTLKREGLQRALGLLDDGKAECLVVAKLDRLTRSVRDLDWLLENYFKEKFSLMSMSEKIDTTTAAGRMMLNLLSVISQWEREVISERTSAALQYKISQGQYIGGAGYGYEVVEEKLEKVEAYKTVQLIQQMRREGSTLQAIANHLNSEGVKTARGGKWYAKTISNIIKREERLKTG